MFNTSTSSKGPKYTMSEDLYEYASTPFANKPTPPWTVFIFSLVNSESLNFLSNFWPPTELPNTANGVNVCEVVTPISLAVNAVRNWPLRTFSAV